MSLTYSRLRNLWSDALGVTGLILRRTKRSNPRTDPSIAAADGEPDDTLDAEPNASIRVVSDATDPDRAFAIRIGGVWYYAQLSAAADTALLDAHLDGSASRHDATEVDYERVDGSKKNILAASDAVEAALTNLDDAIAALSGLTTTDKASVVAAINEVDANADAAQAAVDAVEAQVGVTVLANLTTTDKTGLQPAINEVDANVAAAELDIIAMITRYENGAVGWPNIADGTTNGRLKTTNAAAFRVAGALYDKAGTDDLWNLSGEANLVGGEYRAYWLYVDAAGAASIAAGTIQASAALAIAALPAVTLTKSVMGTYVAGPNTNFANALDAQGDISNGWPATIL